MDTPLTKPETHRPRRPAPEPDRSVAPRAKQEPAEVAATPAEAPPPAAPFAYRRKPHKNPRADLRPGYRLTVEIGLVFALIVVIGLFTAPMQPQEETFNLTLDEQELVQMEEIQQTHQEAAPPPPPRPPVPIEVPNDVVLDDVELDLDATLDLDEAITELPPPPPAPEPEEEVVVEEEEPEIFVVVEQMPTIVGGQGKVYELLEYPELARQAGMEGMVVIQFVVEPNGEPSNISVARSAGGVLDEAAIKAVRQLQFTPGLQRGRAVRVRFAIPIRFQLRDPNARRNS